jgi:hypothetical protein
MIIPSPLVALACISGAVICSLLGQAQSNTALVTDTAKEKFLSSAKIVSTRNIDQGVTKPLRATLNDGAMGHDAQIQRVDKDLPPFFGSDGTPIPMRDCWRFNIAAYKIARLLGLSMIPVSVARSYNGEPAAFTWWSDDARMTEVERRKQGLDPPDREAFSRQMEVGKAFDELIINIDRNLGNLLIANDWTIILIDHTRSFTPYRGIRNPDNLTRCSRRMLGAMQELTETRVAQAVGKHLTPVEIRAILSRRDRIVEYFQQRAAEKGENEVFFP